MMTNILLIIIILIQLITQYVVIKTNQNLVAIGKLIDKWFAETNGKGEKLEIW